MAEGWERAAQQEAGERYERPVEAVVGAEVHGGERLVRRGLFCQEGIRRVEPEQREGPGNGQRPEADAERETEAVSSRGRCRGDAMLSDGDHQQAADENHADGRQHIARRRIQVALLDDERRRETERDRDERYHADQAAMGVDKRVRQHADHHQRNQADREADADEGTSEPAA